MVFPFLFQPPWVGRRGLEARAHPGGLLRKLQDAGAASGGGSGSHASRGQEWGGSMPKIPKWLVFVRENSGKIPFKLG